MLYAIMLMKIKGEEGFLGYVFKARSLRKSLSGVVDVMIGIL